MSESLITDVREFLRAAAALYGTGDPAAAPPPPAPVSPIKLPSMSGAVAAAHAEAVATNDARLHRLSDRDALVRNLITRVGESHQLGRKAVAEGSEVFESSVAALGPFAASPFGALALLPPAAGVVASVTGQLASDSQLMTDLAKQTPSQPDADQRRRTRRVVRRRIAGGPVSLASSSRQSSPLNARERQAFRQRLANYAGPVPGMDLALSLAGTPYAWGGFSPGGLDCSGAVSALVNRSLGLDPFADRTSTHTMDGWLAARGALPGLGPGLNIGITDAGVGHTAATLPDGTNFESSGGDGVRVGSGAAGADDPMFTRHWHIPLERLVGGGASIAV
jgi:cell wall-associated NlpC family hydrolase